MATKTSISITTKQIYDEILSITNSVSIDSTTTSTDPIDSTDNIIQIDYDLTNFLLFLFPLYIFAIIFNCLSIYSILVARVYRQYLSNVFLSIICIGSLLNVHGQMFLILLRWSNNSASNQLCSSSYYLRDSGSILLHTHILLLTFERILAYLKKQPNNFNNNLIQKCHFLLIIISLIIIILSLILPIYILKHLTFSPFDGLCIPVELHLRSYKNYLNCIYYIFGHPTLWSSLIIIMIFYFKNFTINYLTLIPMNRIILLISFISCINIIIQTLFDDIIGIGNERPLNTVDNPSNKLYYIMNLRDSISIIQKILIGLTFFVFRPEIRQWFIESMKKFRENKKESVTPQMLDIRNDLEENYDEIDDGNIQFRSDI